VYYTEYRGDGVGSGRKVWVWAGDGDSPAKCAGNGVGMGTMLWEWGQELRGGVGMGMTSVPMQLSNY